MKVLLIATVQSHICQFHRPLVKMLHEHGCEVHVAAKDNLAEKNGLKLDFVDKVFNVPFERSPFNSRNIKAYRQVKEIIEREKYDVVHCNTPVGGIVGRLASRNTRKNGAEVIYTAHGFHFYTGGPKKSWLIYYPIEKYMCKYTDKLITITEEDYKLAKDRFHTKIYRIHGIGARSDKYYSLSQEECNILREELNYGLEDKIILCTGELNANKNQVTAIHAMFKVVKKCPNAKLLLAGNGPTHDNLQAAIEELKLQNNIELLGYRTDLERFVNIADVILSCSFREGLPLNIVEGMICGKPVVVSMNRGHKELIKDGERGFLVKPDDSDSFAEKILALLSDSDLRSRISRNAQNNAELYMDKNVALELENVYFGLQNE